MIRIMIADDHPLIRQGLKESLKSEAEFDIVAEARDGQEVLDLLDRTKLDIIVMDLSMPVMNGLDVLDELRSKHKKVPTLILSFHPESHYAIRSIRSGAAGYVTKECPPEELVYAIRKVARGGRYITPSLADKIAGEIGDTSGRPLHELLSNREYQILCMIASGKSVKDIADELFLSFNTVNTYRNRILEKMGIKSNIELTHYALQYNLIRGIDPPSSDSGQSM
jgi:two-component system, NarL family, invasion response regulator UvrY